MTHKFHPQAEEEYLSSVEYYLSKSVRAGEMFIGEVEIVIQRILESPRAWPEIESNIRRYILHKSPFTIFYSLQTDCILIHAVAHTSRRPGYWLDRRAE